MRNFITTLYAMPLQRFDYSNEDRWSPGADTWRMLSGGPAPYSLDDIAYRGLRYGMKLLGTQSTGVRLGFETGFDSGSTLDYVYRNQPQGSSALGRLIDKNYLNSVGWKGIRQRKIHLQMLISQAVAQLAEQGTPVHVVDIAAGHGRYVFDALAGESAVRSILLRDYSKLNVNIGREMIASRGLTDIARFEQGDAFNREELAALEPRPTLGIVSGLYELFPDNLLVKNSLAGLADADSYDPKYAKWRYDDLPILPEHWQMVVGKDKKKQFDILKKLMNAPDVTEVVNACDAGREGELIFRSVYELAGCQKPMKRLWISSMEDSAIREGFANLRPGADYDGLRDAALCRAKADWLVGINATRLFSVLYHRTLNIGRVMSPTLALIVQREAEIDTFKPVPFYTVALELPGLTVSGERMADKAAAEQLKEACQGANVTIKKVECKEKSEKPPALYDLTTLQRDANRLLGFTAQQTLDYLQSLYEKKLCTYPRTDSRYLTGDMADSLPVLVNLVANAMPFRKGIAITCDPQTVINDKKVTDHHAVIPTRNLKDADLSALPAGEKAVLELVALRLMCAVAQPHIYSETVVIAACAGGEFTAKGKTVKHPGWKALEDAYRAKMKDAEPKKEGAEKALPELTEGQTLSVSAAIVKEGKSSPPQHFTEDTLLSAMETAGKEDMPEDAERKGLGTPATRAGILEKLVSAGFLERKKSRKTVQLLPSHDAVSLITVLPEQLQSPLLTAEWEYRLGEIERGQLAPEEFLDGISTMLKDLVGTYQVIKGTEYLFTPPREVVGKCPRCGGEVAELQKGFFCQNDSCKFAIWKNNKWWAAKKKQPTKAVVSALLNDGRVRVTGLYSEKTGKTYDATVVLEDDGQYANFKLEFDQRKGGSR